VFFVAVVVVVYFVVDSVRKLLDTSWYKEIIISVCKPPPPQSFWVFWRNVAKLGTWTTSCDWKL